MKQLLTLFLSSFIAISLSAQEAVKDTSYWKKASQFGINFNQGSFSSNWAGGGVNSVALGVIYNGKAEYKKAKDAWTNDFQFQFGSLWTKAQNDWRKNADRLFFDSKYAHQISPKWNLYANFNFLSQIAVGYKFAKAADGRETATKISNLFAPAYFTQAIGFEYKPVPHFSLQLSPLSMRQIIVADKNLYRTFPTNYGVEIGKTVKNELGLFQLVADYNKDLKKDVNLKWRYQAFVPYGKNFGSVDNRLDAQLTAKFAKYFNFNIGFVGMYFQSQSTQIQVSQTMGIGFLYAW
ncbi:MAG: DUF3078 domain-containing protein [Spirosomataceae bacterium]